MNVFIKYDRTAVSWEELEEIFMKVGVTGHRNQRLGLPGDEASKEWEHIRYWISHELSKYIQICAERNEPLELYCCLLYTSPSPRDA